MYLLFILIILFIFLNLFDYIFISPINAIIYIIFIKIYKN